MAMAYPGQSSAPQRPTVEALMPVALANQMRAPVLVLPLLVWPVLAASAFSRSSMVMVTWSLRLAMRIAVLMSWCQRRAHCVVAMRPPTIP